MRYKLFWLLLLLPIVVIAANDSEPPQTDTEEAYQQPTVTIVQRNNTIVEEYRRGGVLYMLKIIPDKGYPYYLIDSDHDGSFDTRRNDLAPHELVQWRLLQW